LQSPEDNKRLNKDSAAGLPVSTMRRIRFSIREPGKICPKDSDLRRDGRKPPGNFMSTIMKKARLKTSAINLLVLLLVNHCKIQPVYRLVSYDAIKDLIRFDPRQTKEGRAIMRQALRDLLRDGFVFLAKRGFGIYLAKRIRYHIVVR
jgi:hypothetical protein